MKWTNEQNAFLKESIKAKADQREVSSKLKRTPGAVYVHAYEMGLKPKSIGWHGNTPPLTQLKEELAEVGTRKKHAVTRKQFVSFRKMDRKQLEQMFKILSISNADRFEREFLKMIPEAPTTTWYSVYSHRKSNLKTVQALLKKLDAKVKKPDIIAAAHAAGKAVGTQVITRVSKDTPDEATILIDIRNEMKLHTQLLSELVGKYNTAS